MEASGSLRLLRSSKSKEDEVKKYNLRSSKDSNESLKNRHQLSDSKICILKKCHNLKPKIASLRSHTKTEKEKTKKQVERLEKIKEIRPLRMHKGRNSKTKPNILETDRENYAHVNSSQNNIRSVKGKGHINKTNFIEKSDSSNFDKTYLINGAVYQPEILTPLTDLKEVKNGIQTRTKKEKRKSLDDDKFYKKIKTVKEISPLRMRKGKRCTDKSKTKVEVLEPKEDDCVNGNPGQNSIVSVKVRCRTNKITCGESTNLIKGAMHLPKISGSLLDLKEVTNNISSLPTTEPSVAEDAKLKNLMMSFVDTSFRDQVTSNATIDFQNEFMTNYNIAKSIISEAVEKISQSGEDFEIESVDGTLNNDDVFNSFPKGEISHCDLNLMGPSNLIKSDTANQVKSQEQICETSSVDFIEEVAAFLDICNEQTSETCKKTNVCPNISKDLNASNSGSDELNQSLPLLQKEDIIDSVENLVDSDMPELSFMGEKNLDLEKSKTQICVDLLQNSCVPFCNVPENGEQSSFDHSVNSNNGNQESIAFTDDKVHFLNQTKGECSHKHNGVVRAEDSVKSQKTQLVSQEIGEFGKDKINIDDLINCIDDDYDEFVVVEKRGRTYGDRYKCGKCCNFFKLKTAHLHKNCDVKIRTVLIRNINFICIKCNAHFENLGVLSTHKKTCLSTNRSVVNKSCDLNANGCTKSLTSVQESDSISTNNISNGSHKSNISCQHVEGRNSLNEDYQNSISSFSCPQCNMHITDKHAQTHHLCEIRESITESENSSVNDNAASEAQNLTSERNLQDSQCLLTQPVTSDLNRDVISNSSDPEMPVFIENMTECGLLYSPNEGAKFFIPLSCKFVNDALKADLQNYFPNLNIKNEPIEGGLEQIPSIPDTCIKCKKPLDLKFVDVMHIDEQACLPDNYNNDLLQLKLPCSSCEHLYPVVFRKDILSKLAELSDKYNLDKFNNLQKGDILLKEEVNSTNLPSTECELILPRIEQVVTISSDDFYKLNENETSEIAENSFQQECADPVNQRTTMQNVKRNVNSSVIKPAVSHKSPSVPESVGNVSTVSHHKPIQNVKRNVNRSVIKPAVSHKSPSVSESVGNVSTVSHHKPIQSVKRNVNRSVIKPAVSLNPHLFPESVGNVSTVSHHTKQSSSFHRVPQS
ncbi:hypothetical protein HNY73_008789 [Argiope bruennichi]|uniref:Uncharacterized protein n=1 Tax=Argiope bruennichi TaxID=94029 RepID=A0A8T0FAB8_ARGBR|nr:hypothetical protein HNY73_008789 [Argiope bruennichi]